MAKPRFTQGDVTRAIRGAQSCGMVVGRMEIDPEGKITVASVEDTRAKEREALQVIEERERAAEAKRLDKIRARRATQLAKLQARNAER